MHCSKRLFKTVMIEITLICITAAVNFNTTKCYASSVSTGEASNNNQTSCVNDWAAPVKSYLLNNKNGTLTRVEFIKDHITVETYNATNFSIISSKKISMELSLFGGFFSGEQYNYVVFGQNNEEQNNDKDVFRIVKYTKNWERVGGDSLKGANTVHPFEGGSLRMCESNNILYIRTCHEMYASSDGYNHQANVTISYNELTDKIVDSFYNISHISYCGYISHSFNQFAQIDSDQLVTADHGDAYPRGISLVRYNNMTNGLGFTRGCNNVSVVSFTGAIGQNFTGASLGGFEVTSADYLVAYNNIDSSSF